MKIIKKINELKKIRKSINGSAGFVPTMGYLHEGHLALVKKSISENEVTFVSIFVNPAQFGPDEDFQKYPRNFDKDCNKLKELGCDFVFWPVEDEIYHNQKVFINIKEYSDVLCGEKRPGHFQGVLTVVAKLFNIVEPDTAYFGQKDYQQLLIIKKLVKDLNFNINIKSGRTIREKDGLAMSSRNKLLNKEERKHATLLFKLGKYVCNEYRNGMSFSEIQKKIKNFLKQNMDTNIMKVDYIEIKNENNLSHEDFLNPDSRLFLAFFCGKTRLIDNFKLSEENF
ncbi:MAG: pantoate--beta-alanine ligase [Candidatus Muiribacteriota bacterium]